MTKELWAAVALTFLVTMGSVFGATNDRGPSPSTETHSSKAHSKTSKPVQDQDIESGCAERFNPYRIQYADTVDQDICAS